MEYLILLGALAAICLVIVHISTASVRALFRLPKRNKPFLTDEAQDHQFGRPENPQDPYSRKARRHFR